MKQISSHPTTGMRSTAGSVLLGAMIFVLAIAAFLVSYFLLVQNSDQTVVRAQRWNAGLAVAEAGIEEGLANLNYGISFSTVSNATTFTTFTHNLGADTYSVSSTATGAVASIVSVGTVTAPVSGQQIQRTVRVTAQRQALFTKGMIALDFIDMNGNSIASDSWDSHDTNQSLNGIYSGYSGTNGDIAAVNGYVTLGNQTIRGNLYLGPTATYDGSGTITGTIYRDANLQYPDAALPTVDTNGSPIVWTPAPTSVTYTIVTNVTRGGVTYQTNSSPPIHDFTSSGYYTVNDSLPIIVRPGVTATLDAKPANFSPSSIDINGGTANSGTLVIYQESGSISLGEGADSNRPENFVVFGLPGVTSVTLGGATTFVGVIYAPEAAMTLNGGGSANNLIGSVVVRSVRMNGHYQFHFDSSLANYYFGIYVVGFWEEL